jgi:hypothetical protein
MLITSVVNLTDVYDVSFVCLTDMHLYRDFNVNVSFFNVYSILDFFNLFYFQRKSLDHSINKLCVA